MTIRCAVLAWTTSDSRWDPWRSCSGVRDRAAAFREHDDRVDLIDLNTDDQKVVKIHSIYVKYLLADDVRGPVVGVPVVIGGELRCRSGCSSPRAGSSSTAAGAVPTRGRGRWSWPSWPSRSGTTTCGCTTTSRRCHVVSRPTCSRRSPCWRHFRNRPRGWASASW